MKVPPPFLLRNFMNIVKRRSYAPDSGPCSEYSKMLVVIEGFPENENNRYSFKFGEKEVTARLLAPGILETHVPPSPAGVLSFQAHCKCPKKGVDLKGSVLLAEETLFTSVFSNVQEFYCTPIEGRLRMMFEQTSEDQIKKTMSKFRHSIRHLDLTNNYLLFGSS